MGIQPQYCSGTTRLSIDDLKIVLSKAQLPAAGVATWLHGARHLSGVRLSELVGVVSLLNTEELLAMTENLNQKIAFFQNPTGLKWKELVSQE